MVSDLFDDVGEEVSKLLLDPGFDVQKSVGVGGGGAGTLVHCRDGTDALHDVGGDDDVCGKITDSKVYTRALCWMIDRWMCVGKKNSWEEGRLLKEKCSNILKFSDGN